MTTNKRPGLVPDGFTWLPEDPVAEMRAELRVALQKIPSSEELKDLYLSVADREKVRRRLMLKAAHNLIFKHIICEPRAEVAPDGSVEIDVSDKEEIELFNSLSAAIRDFSHDAERLDQGYKAELVMDPVNHEGCQTPDLISADRKIVLLALLFIDIKQPKVSEKRQREIAADLTGLSADTLRTYVRNMRAAQKAYKEKSDVGTFVFSEAECDYYVEAEKRMVAIVGRSNRTTVANLIAPVLRGLGAAHQQIRPRSRKKG